MGGGAWKRVAMAALGVWCVVPSLAHAAAPVFGPPAPINAGAATDAGYDGAPRIATDGHGVWMTVWASTDSLGGAIGDDSDVLVARSNDFGISWSAPVAVNNNAAGDDAFDFAPAVATDGHGLWIVAWVATNGPDTDIFVARSADAGASWSAAVPLYADAGADLGNDDRPQIATDGAGTWLVVWDSSGRFGSDRDVLAARSSDGALTWGAPVPLAAGAASDRGADQRPQLASGDAGTWIVVWASNDTLGNTKGNDFDILVVRSSDGGATWTPPVPLNGTAAADHALDDRPQVATDGHGTWVTAWVSDETLGGTLGSDLDVLTARSTDDGATWSAPAALNGNATTDAGEDGAPALVTDHAGTWVAVWESNDAEVTAGDYDVMMAHSIDGGGHWGSPHALDPEASTDARRDLAPQLATDGHGVWNAVWAGAGGRLGADSDVLRSGGRARCGDGTVDPGEQCDDGNVHGGDACPASCEFPPPPTPVATATPGQPGGGTPGGTTGTPGSGTVPTTSAGNGATPTAGLGGTATATPAPGGTTTAAATATPTASADPAATPSPDEATSPAPTAGGPTATGAGSPPTPAATPRFAGGLAGTVTAKAAVACHRAIGKAGAQLVGKRLSGFGGCARAVQRCIQRKPDDVACLGKAAMRCRGAIDALVALDGKIAASMRARCGGVLGLAEVLGPSGLALGNLACAEGLALGARDLQDVVDCMVAEHACRAGGLFEVLQPRAKELMRVPGMNDATLDTVVCLPDHGGAGASVGDPSGAGKAVEICAGAIVKTGTTFVRKRLAREARCVDGIFACVQLAPGNALCLAKAKVRCEQGARISATEERKLTAAVAARCGESIVAYATLRAAHAVNLDALNDACAAVGVETLASLADYQQCVLRADTCRVEGVIGVEAPRAAELMNLVGRPFGSAYCPGS